MAEQDKEGSRTPKFVVYVTPAGYCCTCMDTKPATTGAGASRMAHVHADSHGNGAVAVIDCRIQPTSP